MEAAVKVGRGEALASPTAAEAFAEGNLYGAEYAGTLGLTMEPFRE